MCEWHSVCSEIFFHNISYRDDASELYKYFDISKSVANAVSPLFPEKNIGNQGTFFYTSYRKDGFFVYKYAYFSFEEDSLYFAVDQSEYSADPSLNPRRSIVSLKLSPLFA